jgi:hypothetical protein
MSELNYIDANDLVFESGGGVHSGGFSVKSIMMKSGLSPIMTINTQQIGGNYEKVSDLFNDLVIPNWALSYNNRIVGGKYEEVHTDSDSEDEDDVIDDDLHDKLLELVKEHNIQQGKGLKKKITRKHRIERKKYTKRRK